MFFLSRIEDKIGTISVQSHPVVRLGRGGKLRLFYRFTEAEINVAIQNILSNLNHNFFGELTTNLLLGKVFTQQGSQMNCFKKLCLS